MPRFLLYLSLVLVLPKVRNVRAAYGVDSAGNWDCQGATVTATHTKRCVRDSEFLLYEHALGLRKEKRIAWQTKMCMTPERIELIAGFWRKN